MVAALTSSCEKIPKVDFEGWEIYSVNGVREKVGFGLVLSRPRGRSGAGVQRRV